MKFLERNLIVIFIVASFVALVKPEVFLWVRPHISIFLGLIMFGIGLTLTENNLLSVWRLRRKVVAFTLAKFTIMPLLALGIGLLFKLPQELLIGLVIIGACPGGTAANVMSYLSKANVALTVALTIMTTLVSPFVTPAIIYLMLSQHIDVPFVMMLQKVFWVVAFPIIDGLIIRRLLRSRVETFLPYFPSISILSMTFIIGCVVALNREEILQYPIAAFLSVLAMNSLGLLIGSLLAKRAGLSEPDRRAVSFEFGMQDTAIGVVLATQFFGILAALPGTLYSVIQNITGPFLVGRYNKNANNKVSQRLKQSKPIA